MIAALITSAWGVLGPASARVTLPDTSCASAIGVGGSDTPHAYYGGNGAVNYVSDACPDHYSGELGFGVGGVVLFAREGPSADGGDGAVTCYGSADPTAGPTTGHHGAHTTIRVRDDLLGGAVGFWVTRDYNRSADNPILPSSNDGGDSDCGDRVIEPCDPNDSQYFTPPGCNPLDDAQFIYPATGICTGMSSLGDPLRNLPDPALVSIIVDFALSFLGILPGGHVSCAIPGANSWTAPWTLADYAGADGSILLFIQENTRFDSGHFGAGATGAVWTDTWGTSFSSNGDNNGSGKGGGGGKKCSGTVNDCPGANTCSGVVNHCRGAKECTGTVNLCSIFTCKVCDALARNGVDDWIQVDAEEAGLEESTGTSAEP